VESTTSAQDTGQTAFKMNPEEYLNSPITKARIAFWNEKSKKRDAFIDEHYTKPADKLTEVFWAKRAALEKQLEKAQFALSNARQRYFEEHDFYGFEPKDVPASMPEKLEVERLEKELVSACAEEDARYPDYKATNDAMWAAAKAALDEMEKAWKAEWDAKEAEMARLAQEKPAPAKRTWAQVAGGK